MAEKKKFQTIDYDTKTDILRRCEDAQTCERINKGTGFVYVFPPDAPKKHISQLYDWVFTEITVYTSEVSQKYNLATNDPIYRMLIANKVEMLVAGYAKEFGLQKMYAKDFAPADE